MLTAQLLAQPPRASECLPGRSVLRQRSVRAGGLVAMAAALGCSAPLPAARPSPAEPPLSVFEVCSQSQLRDGERVVVRGWWYKWNTHENTLSDSAVSPFSQEDSESQARVHLSLATWAEPPHCPQHLVAWGTYREFPQLPGVKWGMSKCGVVQVETLRYLPDDRPSWTVPCR
jgi:hypothetical protein